MVSMAMAAVVVLAAMWSEAVRVKAEREAARRRGGQWWVAKAAAGMSAVRVMAVRAEAEKAALASMRAGLLVSMRAGLSQAA